jgi:hypothetical protein
MEHATELWRQARLQVRFEYDKGPALIIERHEGMHPEEAARTPIRMLESNRLQGWVPLRAEVTDGCLALRYDIRGLRPLTTALQTEQLTDAHWEGMAAAFLISLEEGEDLLIKETEMVFHPDWIWVDGDVRHIRFMAVPLGAYSNACEPWQQWDALFRCMVRQGLPSALHEKLNPQRWDRKTFSHRLWIESWANEDISSIVPKPSDVTNLENSLSRQHEDLDHRLGRERSNPVEDGETMRFSTPFMTKGEMMRFGASVFGWAAFAYKPSLMLMLLACAVSLPLGFMLRKRYERTPEGKMKGMEVGRSSLVSDDGHCDAHGTHAEPIVPEPLAQRTVLIHKEDATVLLTTLSAGGLEQPPAALEMIREDTGQRETIQLTEMPYRIGRGPVGVQAVIDHAAASRLHLEIDRLGSGFECWDAGSMNGSFLNEIPMQPNERYSLQDGDMIRIPGTTFVFIEKYRNRPS